MMLQLQQHQLENFLSVGESFIQIFIPLQMPHRLGSNRNITHLHFQVLPNKSITQVHYLLGSRMSMSTRKIVEMSTHVLMNICSMNHPRLMRKYPLD